MAMASHPNAIVHQSFVTEVESAEDLYDAVELSLLDCMKLFDLYERRSRNRGSSEIIVVLKEWAVAEWSDNKMRDSSVLLCGEVEDHSEKAYKLRGCTEIDLDELKDVDVDDIGEETITRFTNLVDETDSEYAEKVGLCYVPKSAVKDIYIQVDD